MNSSNEKKLLIERQPSDQKDSEKSSYNQILKSSVIIGGSSVINVLLGIIRTKFMAILLGPSGVGLIGVYTSITNTIGVLSGSGICKSGVRQIAESIGTGDQNKIAITVRSLRWTIYVLGILGTILLFVASNSISRFTFGDTTHVGALAILSITILLATIADGQTALVQGMRRLVDLAKIRILGTFLGTALGIPIIYLFREDGIVPLLLTLSLMTILPSWWYTRRIDVLDVNWHRTSIWTEVQELLSLGLAFTVTDLMVTAASYLIRLIIIRLLGMDAAGQYQAAWVLSGVYVGFILGAMGTDFYPHLTAVAKDNTACNRLVNEQAEVALLLSVPGILATIIFSPLIIRVFYSGAFDPAIDILRWQMLGVLLKVAAWPMGFIILAKGAGKLFVLAETLTHLMSVVSSWLCLIWFGLVGAGVAYFLTFILYWLIVFIIVHRSFGFAWSPANRRLALLVLPVVSIAFLVPFWLSQLWVLVVGGFLTLIVGLLFMKRLFKLIDTSRLPEWVRVTACRLRLLSPSDSS